MPTAIIRPATTADLDIILNLCAAHAAYERCDYNYTGKKELLANHILGDKPTATCIVAELEGEVIGYMTYAKQFSTWDAELYIYMDCLYLDDKARNHGIGPMLMEHMRAFAKAEGIKEIQWQTPDFNTGAIKYYKRIGGISKKKERFFWKV